MKHRQSRAKTISIAPLNCWALIPWLHSRFSSIRNSHSKQKSGPTTKAPENTKSSDARLTQAVWELLSHILHFPDYASSIAKAVHHEWINISQPEGKLLVRLLAEYREGLIESTDSLEKLIIDEYDRKLLADIHSRELDIENPNSRLKFAYKNCTKTT